MEEDIVFDRYEIEKIYVIPNGFILYKIHFQAMHKCPTWWYHL